jgi:hypothetical protein
VSTEALVSQSRSVLPIDLPIPRVRPILNTIGSTERPKDVADFLAGAKGFRRASHVPLRDANYKRDSGASRRRPSAARGIENKRISTKEAAACKAETRGRC